MTDSRDDSNTDDGGGGPSAALTADTDRISRLKQKQGVTTRYKVLLTLERGSKWIWAGRSVEYCSPAPTSEEEAIELAKQEYDDEIETVRGVETEEVPAPAKWDDDDSRIRSIDTGADQEKYMDDAE